MRCLLSGFILSLWPLMAQANPVETYSGQIVCADLDEMQEYVKAIAAADRAWRDQIKSCVLSLPGTRLAIIEKSVPAGAIRTAAKVRIFSRDGSKSVIGYAIFGPGQ